MSAHRFFLTAPLPRREGEVVLPLAAEDVRHAVSVLRIRAGEKLEVVEPGADSAWLVEVSVAAKDGISARPLQALERVSHPRVTLVQAVAKGEKMDAIVRQAVEVGAEGIIPVLTARSVVRLDDRKRADRGERWRRIAKSAAEQSHRSQVPHVQDPVDLVDVLPALDAFDEVIVLWEEAGPAGLQAAVASWSLGSETRVAVVVGPEGGLDAAEVQELQAHGATVAGLGPTILRTETAAVVGVALIVHLLGGLGGSRD